MSAEDNLSQELFFKAHRGIPVGKKNDFKVNESALGMHWSAKIRTAQIFGNANTQIGGTRQSLGSQTGGMPKIYHAQIPVSSVETDTQKLNDKKVFIGKSHEEEIPVKEGAPVLITGVTHYRKTKEKLKNMRGRVVKEIKPRTRTYNPPREMKA